MSELDTLDDESCVDALRMCCAEKGWARAVAARRPFGDLDTLRAVAAAELAALDWARVLVALDAHPRIGDRARGGGTEARWSRHEQSAAATDDDGERAELARANIAYEDRFGHVFLICATGLSRAEILRSCRERLAHDADTERGVVRVELARIVDLRVAKLVGGTR